VNAIDLALDGLSQPGAPYAMALNGGVSANTIPASCEATVYPRPGCGPSLWAAAGRPPPPRESWANVTTLLPFVIRARDLWRGMVGELRPKRDSRFEPAEAVANATRIRTLGGGVELTLDARLLPEHDVEDFLDLFQVRAAGLSSDAVEISVAVDRSAAGMSLPESHELVRISGEVLAGLGLAGSPRAKPTSTEAGVFARAGVPALVFGPSRSTDNAHTANECANLTQVERAIDVYEALICRLCG
jgi:acetylornithine deacetylase/succinyl-diaminopimelate desuccinylase-like protein